MRKSAVFLSAHWNCIFYELNQGSTFLSLISRSMWMKLIFLHSHGPPWLCGLIFDCQLSLTHSRNLVAGVKISLSCHAIWYETTWRIISVVEVIFTASTKRNIAAHFCRQTESVRSTFPHGDQIEITQTSIKLSEML